MLVALTCLMSPVMPRPDRYYNPYYPYYGYYGYYGQCLEDRDCSYSTACYNTYCRDPCIGACGYNANCKVNIKFKLMNYVSLGSLFNVQQRQV